MKEPDLGARWRWLRYRDRNLGALTAASFVEWRYFAVLSPAFHGMIGLCLVNPERRFPAIAEGGLLVIVAGLVGRGALPEVVAPRLADREAVVSDGAELCWMHLLALETCRFDLAGAGALDADDGHCRVTLRVQGPARADLSIETRRGLSLRLSHQGASGYELPPAVGKDLGRPLGRSLGSRWQVRCPSPLARCDGELRFAADALGDLAESPGGAADSYASAALRELVAAKDGVFRWDGANGYAEHSVGVRPLPLQGWDFLFVPSLETGTSVVLQTYRGSRALRYLEVCWLDDGVRRHHRFEASRFRLDWAESAFDPILGVRRPLRRTITASDAGLRLRLDSRVLRRIPLLRPHRLAVRHFFISEEIGVADWRLSDGSGRVLAEVSQQSCGGELAHVRWRTPQARR